MLGIIVLGIVKVLDNIISTAKSITTYQNRKILSSILVVISQFIFYFVIKSVVSDGSTTSTIVVCICSGIGTYLAMFINDKFKKDATFTNILTCSSNDSIDELCEYLLSHKIKYIPVDSYNRRNERTKTVMAFAQTRSKSKLIDSFLDNSETKYLRQILH
jgi:uncharacterized protein YebE (UPF0316 family)